MSKGKKYKIATNVVTYNRKLMLGECLDSLLNQTYPLDAIYIIDNASTDGTPEFLKQKGFIDEIIDGKGLSIEKVKIVNMVSENNKNKNVEIHYVRMPENTGSSGGQYEGVKRGYEKRFEWLWLMDDDVVVAPNALSELLKCVRTLPRVGLLSSRVIGTDGRSMNVPHVDDRKGENGYPCWEEYLDRGLVRIRFATFVSMLVSREAVNLAGLPIKEFFIWGDDYEFSLRVTSTLPGYLVGRSVVVHKRSLQEPPRIFQEDDLGRIRNFFFMYRNNIYIARRTQGQLRFICGTLWSLSSEVARILQFPRRHRFLKVWMMLKGTLYGLFFAPKVGRVMDETQGRE